MAKAKGRQALRKTGRAVKSAAKSLLASGAEILGAGAMALNPVRRKIRNKYVDLVIRGQAKKTPKGWKVGKRTFEPGRGTVSVSSGYYLDKATGLVYAKRARNSDKKDSDHPIEVTRHWRAGPPGYLTPWQRAHHAGQKDLFAHGIKPAKRRNPKGPLPTPQNQAEFKMFYEEMHRLKHLGASRTAAETALMKKIKSALARYDKGLARAKKNAARSVRTSRKKAGRARAASKTRNGSRRGSMAKARKKPASRVARGKRNPSARSIRKKFAGSVSGSRDLFFPQGTPSGQLAKLGKLVLIQTEKGTIRPVNGTAWLCADTKERLHIGSTTNAPLYSGPARSFGKVTKVEYESSKPHLGYRGPIIWFHHMGERGGVKPTLHADGKGGLKFRGGRYKLTTRGIEH